MKIYTIVDKTEEKFLRTKTADFDFSEYTKKDIDGLIKKMKSAMLKAKGIGLSGNQIGLNLNFFIAQIPKIQGQKIVGRESYTIFNPKITKISKQTIVTEEGCLSVPGASSLGSNGSGNSAIISKNCSRNSILIFFIASILSFAFFIAS